MQQSALRSQFFVAGTARVCRIVARFERTELCSFVVAAVIAAACCQVGLANEPEDGLLDFTATWCGPCQQMSSIVSRLERQGAPIRKVDIDKEPELARRFGVQSIPCFILVSNGQEVDRVTGLTTEKQLVSMLNRLPKAPPPVRPAANDARDDVQGMARLGAPVPLTRQTAPDRKKNPQLLPTADFADGAADRTLAAGPEAPTFRGQNPEEASDPAQAAVRISVKDGHSVNFGSGTVIESRPGQSVILTCGHIFRDLSKDAVVEIDLFPASKGAKPESVVGRVLFSDPRAADVGIVTIAYARRLPFVRIASLDRPLLKQDRLVSVGCSGGDKPTREDHQLTSLNKYDGPENLECTGLPQQGRSGGGLFRGNELVGICIAADPKLNRGIYTGLKPIGVILDKVGMANLVPKPSTPAAHEIGQIASVSLAETKAIGSDAGLSGPGHSAAGDDDVNRLLERELNIAGDGQADLAGAEVVCIVRSRTPGVPSRVIIVNQASERFVADLLHESRGDAEMRQANRAASPAASTGLGPSRPVETSLEQRPFRRPAVKPEP